MVCGINAPAMFFLLLKGSIKRVVSSISVYLALILADFLETQVHNTRPKKSHGLLIFAVVGEDHAWVNVDDEDAVICYPSGVS
jgi:hypothetical protein